MTHTKSDRPERTEAGSLTLIDDDTAMHFIFKVLMKRFNPGFKMNVYASALKALQLLANDAFHTSAILLDINMPVMNGWQFLEEMEKRRVHIPVYMLSSSDNMIDVSRSEEFKNVARYFVKPLTTDHIHTIFSDQNLTGPLK